MNEIQSYSSNDVELHWKVLQTEEHTMKAKKKYTNKAYGGADNKKICSKDMTAICIRVDYCISDVEKKQTSDVK